MAVNLRGKSFLTLMDFGPEEIRYLLDLAKDLKANARSGIRSQMLKGKNICLLFEKTSTRTRCAFEVACCQEGGNVTFLDSKSSQMGKKESLEDTAKVLGRFYDGIEYRGYDQSVVENLAKYAGVPVWNGLTDVDHPTQISGGHDDYRRTRTKAAFAGKSSFLRRREKQYVLRMDARVRQDGNELHQHTVPKNWRMQIDPDVIRQDKRSGRKDRRRHRNIVRREFSRRSRCDIYRHMGVHGRRGSDTGKSKIAHSLQSDGRDAEKDTVIRT